MLLLFPPVDLKCLVGGNVADNHMKDRECRNNK